MKELRRKVDIIFYVLVMVLAVATLLPPLSANRVIKEIKKGCHLVPENVTSNESGE